MNANQTVKASVENVKVRGTVTNISTIGRGFFFVSTENNPNGIFCHISQKKFDEELEIGMTVYLFEGKDKYTGNVVGKSITLDKYDLHFEEDANKTDEEVEHELFCLTQKDVVFGNVSKKKQKKAHHSKMGAYQRKSNNWRSYLDEDDE